ncbi:class IV adenylate cyclase [Sulfuracidifex tepidarius]|uniref:CYTH domain-containing protein n=1 Tax=Sulfuracidifex tepidarius TaxID=1294262 RepID=A0A510DWX4_9CREN|nr:class IV adenylate cyclase [Sulfuracidifex tepidarius]BBG24480.1 hypothetical protein IC006_1801 [Sulfuracidifex tepidarius]BBG27238.1 hypothetical protein IC007_1779 [Sulfuracidifex tepidarius]
MIEREVKLKLKSPSLEELEKLLERRSVKLDEEVQEDIYFNYKYRDFKDSDEAVRLRKSNNEYELTYKGPKTGNYGKSREEITVRISEKDVQNINIIMERIGLYKAFTVKKTRKNFKIDSYIISLDRVEGLGDFVEVEGQDVTESQLKDFFQKFIDDFQIKGEVTNISYLELLLRGYDKSK